MPGDWSRLEVEATVADYFDMFESELRGEPYKNAEHNRPLRALLDDRARGGPSPPGGWNHIIRFCEALTRQRRRAVCCVQLLSHMAGLERCRSAGSSRNPGARARVSLDAPSVRRSTAS